MIGSSPIGSAPIGSGGSSVVGSELLAPPGTLASTGFPTASLAVVNATAPVGRLQAGKFVVVSLIAPAGLLSAGTGGIMSLVSPTPTLSAYGGANAAIAAPMATLTATAHNSAGENNFSKTAPAATLSAYCGGNATLSAPNPALIATATGVGWAHAALTAPSGRLSASGQVSAVAKVAVTAPMSRLVGYGGAVCSVSLAGFPTLQATGTAGSVGHVAVTLPMAQLTASGTAQSHGGAILTAPAGKMAASLQAYLIAPGGRLTAIGTAVVTATYEAYALNLNHNDPAAVDEMTRYTNFPFTHIVRYKNSYYGVAAGGLYLLEGTTDHADPEPTAIPWAFKTATTDFKSPFIKTVVSTYFAGRMGPDAAIDLYVGEDGAKTYSYQTPRTSTAKNFRQKFGRGNDARYYALGASGDGELALDEIQFNTLNHTRRI